MAEKKTLRVIATVCPFCGTVQYSMQKNDEETGSTECVGCGKVYTQEDLKPVKS